MTIQINNPSPVSAGGGTTDHSALSNLDYASAAHTGFQATVTSGVLGVTAPLNTDNSRTVISGAVNISMTTSSATSDGYLNFTDWGVFNGKFNTVTTGTINATTPVTVTASRSILGGAATIAVTTGILTVSAPLNTASVLSIIGGANTISMTTASNSTDGYVDSTRYQNFNRKTKSFVVYSPPGSATYPVWKTPTAITITSGNALVIGGTSVTGQLQEADGNGGTGVEISASGAITAGTNTGLNITNASVDAGDYILWVTTATSGTPASLSVSFSCVEA